MTTNRFTDACIVCSSWNNAVERTMERHAEFEGREIDEDALAEALNAATAAEQWLHTTRLRVVEVLEGQVRIEAQASYFDHANPPGRSVFRFTHEHPLDEESEHRNPISAVFEIGTQRKLKGKKFSVSVRPVQQGDSVEFEVFVRGSIPCVAVRFDDYQRFLDHIKGKDYGPDVTGDVLLRDLSDFASEHLGGHYHYNRLGEVPRHDRCAVVVKTPQQKEIHRDPPVLLETPFFGGNALLNARTARTTSPTDSPDARNRRRRVVRKK